MYAPPVNCRLFYVATITALGISITVGLSPVLSKGQDHDEHEVGASSKSALAALLPQCRPYGMLSPSTMPCLDTSAVRLLIDLVWLAMLFSKSLLVIHWIWIRKLSENVFQRTTFTYFWYPESCPSSLRWSSNLFLREMFCSYRRYLLWPVPAGIVSWILIYSLN